MCHKYMATSYFFTRKFFFHKLKAFLGKIIIQVLFIHKHTCFVQ